MAINKVTLDGNDLIDLTQDTVTEDAVGEGVTFHDASGAAKTGTLAAVQYTPQTLTSEQQAQARTNIDAADLHSLGTLQGIVDDITTGVTSVPSAVKATQDANGNVITDTYAPKQTASGGFEAGQSASASTESIAIGPISSVGGAYAVGIGRNINTLSDFSVSIGSEASADGESSISIGTTSSAANITDIAIGRGGGASGGYSIAIGNNAQTSGANAIAIGNGATASSSASIQIGSGTNAGGYSLQVANYPLLNLHTGNIYPARLLNTLFPVGSYYITESSTTPASLFGGSWARVSEKFLFGANGNGDIGSEGGEWVHTLTTAEMPSHNHDSIGGLSWSQTLYALDTLGNSENGMGVKTNTDNKGAGYRSKMETNNTGGNAAHNNMPPYRKVNIWRRTA